MDSGLAASQVGYSRLGHFKSDLGQARDRSARPGM